MSRVQPWQPFLHDELQVKQKFLELARDFTKNPVNTESVAHELAGGLLYANLAEYVAAHLLESLKSTVKQATSSYFFGVITLQLPDSRERPLGDVVKELGYFEFPLKAEILSLLKEIKASRNKLSHKILKVPADQLIEIDEAIRAIAANTEELVTKVDTIYGGMPPRSIQQPQLQLPGKADKDKD